GTPEFGIFSIPEGAVVTMGSLTIAGGVHSAASLDPAGIFNWGTLTLHDAAVSSNSAVYGGAGIYNIGMATIERCTITGNSSDYSGAGVVNGGTMTMSDCTLSDNMVGEHGDGGAVENDRTLTVTHCDLRRNKATGSNGFAGAIMNFGGT